MRIVILSMLQWLLWAGAPVQAAYQVERPPAVQQRLEAALKARGSQYHPRARHLKADGSPLYTNRLILEDSPYLLQHAHNPVDWYPWGEEAFARARQEHKPIFLSIGYSTCHWCHVMERESFEDLEVARFLNEHFVAVKVDRESMPDVDAVYLEAVERMSGRGGWPMSLFLTPDGKPFQGGTYYPRDTFLKVLRKMEQVWTQRHDEVLAQAQRVADAVAAEDQRRGEAAAFDPALIARATRTITGMLDELQGGFGYAPKFPREPWLFLLLDQAERRHDADSLRALEITLDAMARGGIFDQVGGGFHRYATDNAWLVPHFEKMLYNQANLGRVYLDGWRLTGRDSWRRVLERTLDYVLRDMSSPQGGFYSASDADSAGREGLFFTWTVEEMRRALPAGDADLAIALYGLSEGGNFEGRNILHLPEDLHAFALSRGLGDEQLQQRIERINERLRRWRERRVPPLRDDKIITAWNGMMIGALAEAARVLDSPVYRQAAERAATFVWQHNHHAGGQLWRAWLGTQADGGKARDRRGRPDGTLADYAHLAAGLLDLYDLDHDPRWLARSRELADAMLARFFDPDRGRFYLNEAGVRIATMPRPQDDGLDGALPSLTSVALRVLGRLWRRSGESDYLDRANAVVAGFAADIAEQPSGYAALLAAIDELRDGELGEQAYAARGRIRVTGFLQSPEQGHRTVNVDVHIPSGWHINAHRPGEGKLVATQLRLGPNADGWRLLRIDYPEATLERLVFRERPLAVYQGRARIRAAVEATGDSASSLPLPLILSLQACSNEVCLPPEQVGLSIALKAAAPP